MNTRKLHHSNCLFSYNCVHHAFCYYVIFALLLLVTSLLHALCWNKDHITIYQFYSQLFQALAPVPREVKVVHRKSPTPNPKLQFRQQYGIAWLVYIQRNQLNMSTVWYYLARLYTKTSTKHEYSMVLPCSSIKKYINWTWVLYVIRDLHRGYGFIFLVCVLYSLSRRRTEYRTQTGNMNPYPLWSPNNNYIL